MVNVMAFMEWNDSYNLGIKEIDEQHQNLFALVNKMYNYVVQGAEQNATRKILEELIDYTLLHFATEEAEFKRQQYPKFEEHKQEHDDLVRIVWEFQGRVREKSITISFEVLEMLSDWLKNHTTHSDLEYAKFIHSRQ